MRKTYASIRGTCDFSPSQAFSFNNIINKARDIFSLRGYEEIILPALEEAGVFVRGVGKTSDIVEKQMFKVIRSGSDATRQEIVLRPEGTAQVVRYYLQNHLYNQSSLSKLFYIGAMFRGERPQRGRLRQFNHIGAEVIGSASIEFDVEIIVIALKILDAAGIKDRQLQLNTLGCHDDKENFSKNLKLSLAKEKSHLCEDCQRRLDINPLRILDCKREGCRKIASSLGKSQQHLCKDCLDQFEKIRSMLDALGIKYNHNPLLVRGLDYYTNTVFEITSSKLGSQDALGAGGRYNSLIKDMGGPDIAATGFALGIERMLLCLPESSFSPKAKVYVLCANEELRQDALKMTEKIRGHGIAADTADFAKSLKAQLRYAQKKGACVVVILAEEEDKAGKCILKDMEASTQKVIKKEEVFLALKGLKERIK